MESLPYNTQIDLVVIIIIITGWPGQKLPLKIKRKRRNQRCKKRRRVSVLVNDDR
jgi:hypothetical protein